MANHLSQKEAICGFESHRGDQMKKCCNRMNKELTRKCDGINKEAMGHPVEAIHRNRLECPDVLLHEVTSGEIGLIVHDGGQSIIRINYCPWCGARLEH